MQESLISLLPGTISPWLFLLDLLLVWILYYYLILFVRGTRAVIILVGIGTIALLYVVVSWLDLVTTRWLLEKFFAYGSIALIVIFAPEIRDYLAEIGRRSMVLPFRALARRTREEREEEEMPPLLECVVKACAQLAATKTGAIIALERRTPIQLDQVIVGEELDALVTERLLMAIFEKHSPLHDGGVVITDSRIRYVNCYFHLSENPLLDPYLGSRHRAAVGVTEDSDAVAVVVSEETGQISIAVNGRLARGLTPEEALEQLEVLFDLTHSRATELPPVETGRLVPEG